MEPTAFIALFGWPIVVIILFARLSPGKAIIWSIIAGYLLLPSGRQVDFPVLPAFDKNFMPAFSALICAIFILRNQPTEVAATYVLPGWLPKTRWILGLMAMLVLGSVFTALTNGDALRYDWRIIQGIALYDAGSMALGTLTTLIPFLLARRFLGHPDMHRALLIGLCTAGVGYAFLALYEIRMSPQINSFVYGYFPHSWSQHVRNGGFRPLVFLSHGLWLGIFLSGVTLATACLCRAAPSGKKGKYGIALVILCLTLLLSKNLGALTFALLLMPFLLFAGRRIQLTVAALMAMAVLTYPLLRGANLVPVNAIMSLAESVSPARASSLGTRLTNEDAMLAKANHRPLFGWGPWGRSRVYDERGTDTTLADGYWVIVIGVGGWVRYIGEFGLLGGGIMMLAWRVRKYDVSLETSGLAIVMTGNMLDLIPNAGITPVTWLMAGALAGRIEFGRISEQDGLPSGPTPIAKRNRYTRFDNNITRPTITADRTKPQVSLGS